jgi:DNA repair exonuclease SbcCD ATPase subunit
MLKLKTLRFKNIGRFVEDQEIYFTDLSGLVQVDAENKNTGGSSGSGKSTVFQALEYLLGLNDVPVTILQSRLTKEKISISADFDFDGQPLTVSRSSKGLSINLAGTTTEGSSKLSEELLDSILGMPRDLFRVLMHKRQREGGFFLNLGPKETHAFLVDAKGLKEHATKAEEIDKDLKKLQDCQVSANSSLLVAKSGLESTINALSSIGEAPAPSIFTQQDIDALKAVHMDMGFAFGHVVDKHLLEKEELAKEKPNLSVAPFDRSKIIAIESKLSDSGLRLKTLERVETARQNSVKDAINPIRLAAASLKVTISNGERAKLEAKRIAQEINKLNEGCCPVCEQSWKNESSKAKGINLVAAFEEQKALIIHGMESVSKLKNTEESIAALTLEAQPLIIAEVSQIIAEEKALKVELAEERKLESEHNAKENQVIKLANDAYLFKLTELNTKMSAEKSAFETQLSKANQDLRQAQQDFESASVAALRHKITLDSLSAQKAKKEAELATAESAISELKEKIEIVSEAKSLIKSFISCSFDEALEAIADKATTILRGVPNMATATIQLEGVKETKAGTIKEEVTAVLHVDGEQNVPIKSLSGGERSSVDLAIDLAVIDFLETETGKGIDLFIMDEPFSGLDSTSIEQVLEILQNSNVGKKLILVDHNDVVKQFVQNKILVVREGETSHIEAQ